MSYRIVKEDKDNHLDTVLEVDVVNSFTMNEADQRCNEYIKMKKEADAQVSLSQAVLKNIERNHPKVMKLSATQRNAARMYVENEELIKESADTSDKLDAAIKGHTAMRKEVYKQFNWVDALEENEGETNSGGEESVPEPKGDTK